MLNIIINGAAGRMGHALAEIIAERENCRVIAGMDLVDAKSEAFQTFAPGTYEGDGDVIIDVTYCDGIGDLLTYAKRRKLPLVICTTGHNAEQLEMIKQASTEIPIFHSGNMSLGINLLSALAKKATQILGETFDIEIVEAHHNKKLDAPSGTALMLANSVSEGLSEQPVYTYDRHSVRQARRKEEIGIHSIRGGTIVGEHSVIFAGQDEVLTLSHSAGSRKMFAGGAVNAAVFIAGKKSGLYDMNALLNA